MGWPAYFPGVGTLFAVRQFRLTPKGKIILFSTSTRHKHALSRRSRIFIRIHHLAVFALVAWIAYLFTIRELL